MTEGKAPAFQFYASDDWFAHPVVRLMDYEEKGIYVELKAHCWLHQSIPADLGELARLLRLSPEKTAAAWVIVGRCFKPHPTDLHRLVQPEIEQKRTARALFLERSAEGGRRSVESRRKKSSGNAPDTKDLEAPFEPKANSSSSSSSSSVRSSSPPAAIVPVLREKETRKRLLDLAGEYKRAAQEAVMPGPEQEALINGADQLREMAMVPEKRPARDVFDDDITAYARSLGQIIALAERHNRGFRLTADDQEAP